MVVEIVVFKNKSVKKMKKNQLLLLFLAIGLSFISCANDYEFIKDYQSLDWETSLKQIVSENLTLYSNSDIFLKSYEEIDIYSLNRYSFINPESRYPVMTGNKITLAPYEFIRFDTLMCHVKSFHIDNLVNYSLKYRSELVAIELQWVVDDVPMTTIALFDKKNGELVYDNILYNTITIGENRLNNLRKQKLTRSEWGYSNGSYQGGITIYESDSFSYSDENGTWIATINLEWHEHGYWTLQITDLEELNMYRFDYIYKHSNTEFFWNVSKNTPYSSSYSIQYLGVPWEHASNEYSIKYYFYVGLTTYPVTISSEPEGTINTNHGVVKIYTDDPYRSPDFVDKDQFPQIEP